MRRHPSPSKIISPIAATVCRNQRGYYRVVMISVALFGLAISTKLLADELAQPTRTERLVSKLVAKMMQEDHLSNRALDDTISGRAFDQFIKMLDPMKVYFTQEDVDSFEKWKTKLDDQLKEGDYSAAFEIFELFLKRVDQRTETALEMIDVAHDFSDDENMVTDPKLLNFAKSDEEAREMWRKRIKYSLLVLESDNSDEAKKTDKTTVEPPADSETKKPAVEPPSPQELLRKRYQSFARRMHQTDSEDVVEMYVSAITSSFDPHTSYMSKGTFENFLIQMGLQLEGIGATLQGTDDGYTVIRNIVPGGAADTQGGLKVDDKIMAVGQGNEDGQQVDGDLAAKNGLDFVDAISMKLDDVVGMIRGKAGTVVRLQVMSENDLEMHVITIVREKIKLEDSAAHGAIFEEGKKQDGSPNKIGVIDLPSFYAAMDGDNEGRSATSDVRDILDDFREKSVDAVVFDLRRNGGGSLREAIDCTGLFIDIGPVVQVKDAYGKIEKHNDEVRGASWDGPLVVLTSKFSASASEILAGAVQDYHRGLVVGDTTTHGKGTVQSLVNLDQLLFKNYTNSSKNTLGALKITMQQFYRPNGDSTQKRGVLSDLVLPSLTDKMDVSESDLDYAVEFDTVPPASYKSYDSAADELKQQLSLKSQARVNESTDFVKLVGQVKHYVEQKELKAVSLNKEQFLARRAQLNAEKEDEKAAETQDLPNREIERNFYLDEVLRITADYMDLLRVQS